MQRRIKKSTRACEGLTKLVALMQTFYSCATILVIFRTVLVRFYRTGEETALKGATAEWSSTKNKNYYWTESNKSLLRQIDHVILYNSLRTFLRQNKTRHFYLHLFTYQFGNAHLTKHYLSPILYSLIHKKRFRSMSDRRFHLLSV